MTQIYQEQNKEHMSEKERTYAKVKGLSSSRDNSDRESGQEKGQLSNKMVEISPHSETQTGLCSLFPVRWAKTLLTKWLSQGFGWFVYQ